MRLPAPSLRWQHASWPPLLAALATLLAAQLMQAATGVADQFWAARAGQGALSVMGYANRLLFLVLGLGSVAIARVLLPTLASLSVAHRAQARQLALRWAWRILGLGTLGVLLLWPLAPWLVALLFERGAFGPEDTQRVASFLQVNWLQVPPALAALVLIQQVLAERRYGVLKRLGTSPLPRSGLLAGKVGALLLVELLQIAVIAVVGFVLGWKPDAPHKKQTDLPAAHTTIAHAR